MGYYLQALIGKMEELGKHKTKFQHLRVITLPQGMVLIPLTDDLYDEIGSGDEIDRFQKLSPAVEQWAMEISRDTPIAYIEAEFFGGFGGQGAVVWSGKTRVMGPIHSKNAINHVLRYFGIQVGTAYDEFDAIKLGQHRDTQDWIQLKPK